jgi:hypothetical protein
LILNVSMQILIVSTQNVISIYVQSECKTGKKLLIGIVSQLKARVQFSGTSIYYIKHAFSFLVSYHKRCLFYITSTYTPRHTESHPAAITLGAAACGITSKLQCPESHITFSVFDAVQYRISPTTVATTQP